MEQSPSRGVTKSLLPLASQSLPHELVALELTLQIGKFRKLMLKPLSIPLHPLKIDAWTMKFPFKMVPCQGTCQFLRGLRGIRDDH